MAYPKTWEQQDKEVEITQQESIFLGEKGVIDYPPDDPRKLYGITFFLGYGWYYSDDFEVDDAQRE